MKKITTCALIVLVAAAVSSITWACKKNDSTPVVYETDPNVKGCGNFYVTKIVDTDMILSISVDKSKVEVSTKFNTFEQIENESFAHIQIVQNCNINQVWYSECNDVVGPRDCESEIWQLVKGKLSFKATEPDATGLYAATVILENAEFKKVNTGETRTFEKVEFNAVQVGWFAG